VRIAESGSPADAEPVELAWDRAGRLVERRVGDRAVGWSYDPDGLRSGLTHPDGSRTGYRRDAAGRVSALSHPLLGRIELTRDPDGRLLSMSGAGAGARWTYDDGWLSEHRATFDGRQRTTRLRRDEHGRVQIEQTDGRSRQLHYDAGGQLDRADDAEGRRSYRYDPAGRLSAETGPQGPRGYSYDPAGQLLFRRGPDGERRYRYDDVGRRVAEHGEHDSRSYDWDDFGRLRAVHTATADGTRSSVALQTDTVGELTEAGDVGLAWDSAAGSAPLVAIGEHAVVGYGHPWALVDAADGSPRYLHPDWQGTVAGGDHDPWGSTPGGIGLGYRGELAVDGLIWLRNRAYDPATRGFLQVDPWPAVPGTAVAGHPYHYAGNDPINNVDPLGRRPVTDADLAAQRDEDGGGGWLSDLGHGVLDVVGLVPGVGEVADLANAAWYTAEGDYVLAGLSAAAAIPFAGWLATGGKAAVKGARAAEKLSPHAIRFSQSSVNGAAAIEASMRADGWVGDAIDVVRMSDGGLTSVDNTRLLAAKRSDIDVDAHVHTFDDALPAEFAERFVSRKGDVPTNWGEAVTNRIDSQNAGFRNAHPQGSPITGWSGN